MITTSDLYSELAKIRTAVNLLEDVAGRLDSIGHAKLISSFDAADACSRIARGIRIIRAKITERT